MDNIFKLIFLFLMIGWSVDSWAVPRLPTYNKSSSGPYSTYTVDSVTRQPYVPTYSSPSGTGMRKVDDFTAAQGQAYTQKASIPVGDTFESFKQTIPVSNSAMAFAFSAFIPKMGAWGMAIGAGMALYDWLSALNFVANNDGTVSKSGVTGQSCDKGSATYCKPDPYSFCAQFSRPDLNVVVQMQGDPIKDYCGSGRWGGVCQRVYNGTIYQNDGFYCVTSPTTTTMPSTLEELKTAATTTPAPEPARVIQEIHSIDPSGSSDPIADGTPDLTLDVPSITSAPRQTVTPDGRVRTDTDTTTFTKTGNQTFTSTTNTTTVFNNTDNSTTTVTTANATPPVTASTPSDAQKTDCDKYPDAIGCAKFGDAPASEVVQTVNVTATLNPTSLGAGSCPSPNVVHLSHGRTVTVSYQPECDLATGIAPIMIALAWLAAGMLVLSPVRG